MSWDDMWRKFEPLVERTLGDRSRELYDLLRAFEEPGSLDTFVEMVGALGVSFRHQRSIGYDCRSRDNRRRGASWP